MAGGLENPEKHQLSQGFCFLLIPNQIDIRRQKKPKGDRNVSVFASVQISNVSVLTL